MKRSAKCSGPRTYIARRSSTTEPSPFVPHVLDQREAGRRVGPVHHPMELGIGSPSVEDAGVLVGEQDGRLRLTEVLGEPVEHRVGARASRPSRSRSEE